MRLPGFTADSTFRLHGDETYRASGGAAHRNGSVTPAWWDIGECGMGLCLVHCYEDEGAKQSVCKVYDLPF